MHRKQATTKNNYGIIYRNIHLKNMFENIYFPIDGNQEFH